jgi:hypothetical protein
MRFVTLSVLMLLAGLFVTSAQQPASSELPSWEQTEAVLAQSQPEQGSFAESERVSSIPALKQSEGCSGGCTGMATRRAVTSYSNYQPVYSANSNGNAGTVQFVGYRQPVRNTVRAGAGIVRRVASLPVQIVQNSRARRAARWGYDAPQYEQPQYQYVETVPQVQYVEPAVQAVNPVHYSQPAIETYTPAAPQPQHFTSTQQQPAVKKESIEFPRVNNCPNGICPLPRKDCK